MPDSSSAATSFGRSIGRSLRRDHIPPSDIHSSPSSDLEADAFQRHAADLLTDLLAPDLLSLAWTSRLLDSFLLCLEQFRALLFGSGAAAAARPPLDRLVADFFERAVKALDLCNAVRDGLDLVRQWRNHLAIAARVLASDDAAALGEAQIRRARKALTDLTINRPATRGRGDGRGGANRAGDERGGASLAGDGSGGASLVGNGRGGMRRRPETSPSAREPNSRPRHRPVAYQIYALMTAFHCSDLAATSTSSTI